MTPKWAIFTLLLADCIARLPVAAQNVTTSEHYRVCSADFPPMASCNTSRSTDPSAFNGFDIELFRRIATIIGWEETSDATAPGPTFEFYCMSFSDMIADLTDPEGNCTLASAGITISSEREEKGIKFSYPTYRSSLSIMVHATETSDNGWFFLRPFKWDVWVAILVTVFLIPIVTFITEFISIQGKIRGPDVVPGMKEATWRSVWTMLLLEPFQVTAISSRVIAILYGFVATVLVNTYCANLAAALTVSQLSTSIRSVDDLRGKAVGTIPVYIPRLTKLGIAAVELPFEGITSAYNDWVPKLRQGILLATAIDEPVQQYVAATGGCDLVLVDNFVPFDFGLAFRKGTERAFVDVFDEIVLQMQEDGVVSELRANYIAIPRTNCDTGVSESSAINFQQVSGLWIIMAAGIGAGLLWLLGLRLYIAYRQRHSDPPAKSEGTGPAGRHKRTAGHTYRPGIAFKQTVSIYGAQIGTARQEAKQQAREAEAAAAAAAAKSGGDPADPTGSPCDEGKDMGEAGGLQLPSKDLPLPELLAHVRHLCDRLEHQSGISYWDGQQHVVDERIEEVPELEDLDYRS